MSRRPEPFDLVVLDKQPITPRMLRVRLGGDDMARFPAGQAGGYVKLVMPRADADKPLLRTYTIRAQREDCMDVDFALHGDGGGGPASKWALACQPGDAMRVAGPGPRKPIDPAAQQFVMVGDMTSLPAISVNLEDLPPGLSGQVVIEVPAESDRQSLSVPEGVRLDWIINPALGEPTPLLDAVAALDWPEGDVYVWAAGEFSSVLALRQFFRAERGVTRQRMYISSYWKMGLDEMAHREVKRADNEADAAAAV